MKIVKAIDIARTDSYVLEIDDEYVERLNRDMNILFSVVGYLKTVHHGSNVVILPPQVHTIAITMDDIEAVVNGGVNDFITKCLVKAYDDSLYDGAIVPLAKAIFDLVEADLMDEGYSTGDEVETSIDFYAIEKRRR